MEFEVGRGEKRLRPRTSDDSAQRKRRRLQTDSPDMPSMHTRQAHKRRQYGRPS